MKKCYLKMTILFLMVISAPLPCKAAVTTDNFILEEGHSRIERGDTSIRYSPCSTFKILLSLIGFEEGILKNKGTPVWSPDEEPDFDLHKGEQTPDSWMKKSVVWYSQKLTKMLGMEKFSSYITSVGFGNCDATGEPDKDNGLTNCWLSSSLKISVNEQHEFVKKLVNSALPFTPNSQERTRELLLRDEVRLEDGWTLYGKTGSSGDIVSDTGLPIRCGWFIGWIQKEGKIITFARYIEGSNPGPNEYLGPVAKEMVVEDLSKYLESKIAS